MLGQPFQIFPSGGDTGPYSGIAAITLSDGKLNFQMDSGKWSYLHYGTYTAPNTPVDPPAAETGTLTVVKQIPAADYDAAKNLTLTFTLNTDPAQTAALEVGKMTENAEKILYQGTVSFSNLTVGRDYTVTESGAGLTDYTLGVYKDSVADANKLADSAQTLTIASGSGNVLTFINDCSKSDTPVDPTPVTPVTPDAPAEIPDNNTPTTDIPTTDVPEVTAPTAELPDSTTPTTELPDGETPLASAPKTGDGLAVWLTIMTASSAGLAWLVISGKRRQKREKQ